MMLLRELDLKGWLFMVSLIGWAILLAVMAWNGDKAAIALLASMAVALAIFHQVTRALLNGVLTSAQESLTYWKLDTEYSQKVTADYVKVLESLSQYEEAKANYYLERLSAALRERHPDLAEQIAEHSVLN